MSKNASYLERHLPGSKVNLHYSPQKHNASLILCTIKICKVLARVETTIQSMSICSLSGKHGSITLQNHFGAFFLKLLCTNQCLLTRDKRKIRKIHGKLPRQHLDSSSWSCCGRTLIFVGEKSAKLNIL